MNENRNTVTSMSGPFVASDIVRSGRYVLVVGPSGVGKSNLASHIRSTGRRAVDLDLVGYRTDDSRWKEWIIPPAILDVLREGPDTVAVGACSNIDQLLSHAKTTGWKVVFLTATVDTLISRRIQRGDKPEKVWSSMEDLISWDARYESYRRLWKDLKQSFW